MAADEQKELLKLEQALSNRSKCRASGEKIEKGEWRVGIEAWVAGRNSMTWQKAEPFLKNCFLEECSKGNSGTCKVTGHKFAKGETRFVCSTGEKKLFLTIPAAAEVIKPVLDVMDGEFGASDIKGLDEIPDSEREAFKKAFGVTGSGKATKKRTSGRLAQEEAPPKAKKAKSGGGKAAAKQESEEEGSDGEEVDVDKSDGEQREEEEEIKQEVELKEEGPKSPEMSAYEKQRNEIIAKNKAKMEELGLQGLAAQIMAKQEPKPRTQPKGLASKKKKVPYDGPRRASLRQKGVDADGRMIDQELRNGQVVLNSAPGGGASSWVSAGESAAGEPKERHPKETLPFESDNGDKEVDEAFLELLKGLNGEAPKDKAAIRQLADLGLREQDVAKVTSNGISHLQWHPSSSHHIVAAADKSGHVGLWNINHSSENEGDDGVLAFTPHNSYVSGLRWAGMAGGALKLFTSSYDGSMRCLDPSTGSFQLVVSSEEAEFSAMDCTADGNVAILGDNDGYLHIYDIRCGKGEQRGQDAEMHNKRINTLHFAPGEEHLFVSSSSDNSLAIWDLRKLKDKNKFVSLASAVHPKTCQSAYFAPDGSKRVVSLSRDDTVQIWQYDGKSSLTSKVSVSHYNNTGRWILPFRAIWSPAADCIVVGNMKRKVDVFSAEGQMLGGLESDFMTAISSRTALHPHLSFLAASTASGRIHIFK